MIISEYCYNIHIQDEMWKIMFKVKVLAVWSTYP